MTHTAHDVLTVTSARDALDATSAAMAAYHYNPECDDDEHARKAYGKLCAAYDLLEQAVAHENLYLHGCPHMSGYGDNVIILGTVRVVRFTCEDCGEAVSEEIEHWTYAAPDWYQRGISEYQFSSQHTMAGVFMSDSGPGRLASI